MLALLLREFDNQNSVLGGKADENNHADLRVEIQRQPGSQDREECAEYANRDREQNRRRDDPAFVKRDQE